MSSLQIIAASGAAIVVLLGALAFRFFRATQVAPFVLIPLLLGAPVASGYAVSFVMGYPTTDISDLKQKFLYVHHVATEDTIYLTAVPAGQSKPRLYEIQASSLTKEEKEAMGEADKKAEKGAAQGGQYKEGTWVFYSFDADILPPKAG